MESDRPVKGEPRFPQEKSFTPLDLMSYLAAHKTYIAVATLICIFAGGVVALVMPKKYEASAMLVLIPDPVKEAKDKNLQQLGLFTKPLGVKDYSLILKSDGVLAKVPERLRQFKKISEEDLKDFSELDNLQRATTVSATVIDKTAYSSAYSPVIALTVVAGNPEAAYEVAQAWAEVSVSESGNIYRKGKGTQAKFLAQQLQRAETELTGALDEQRENEAQYDPDSAKQRLLDLTSLQSMIEENHYAAKADLDAARTETEQLKKNVAELQPKVTLFQAPPDTALYLEEALGKQEGNSTKQRGYQKEEINPSYVEANNQLIESEKSLKGLEEKEKTLAASIEEIKKNIADERQRFAQFNRQRKFLDKKSTVIGTNYQEVGDRLAQANIAETEEATMGDLKIAADAVIPNKPVGPRKLYILITAAILGFAVACSILSYRAVMEKAR